MSSGSGLTSTVPTTLLDAVNQMLAAIGLAQIVSLNLEDLTEDAGRALAELSEQSRVAQALGWHFNTDEGLELQPTTDGTIPVPVQAASVVLNPRSYMDDAVQRAGKMYDRTRHTFTWDHPLYVDAILLFEYEDLPQQMRWYVTCKAGERFAVGRLPDTTVYKFSSAVTQEAWSALQQWDQDSRGQTLVDSSPHFARFRRGQRSTF